jgi:transcriptional regulator with XRE-family HTH domain
MSDDRDLSLLEQLTRLTGQVAGQTLDVARNTASMTAMFGESWLKSAVMKTFEPERLEAMAEAGHFLRDARETAGLSLRELTDALGVKDDNLLEDIESGDRVMPLELVLRSASLIARHDPIPYLIRFMRTYNPTLGATLEQWGIMALPLQYERERRWINLYRQHDVLRGLTDDEYERLINYVDSATNLVLDVMQKEKAANASSASPGADTPPAAKTRREKKPAAKKKTASTRKTRPKAAKR